MTCKMHIKVTYKSFYLKFLYERLMCNTDKVPGLFATVRNLIKYGPKIDYARNPLNLRV